MRDGQAYDNPRGFFSLGTVDKQAFLNRFNVREKMLPGLEAERWRGNVLMVCSALWMQVNQWYPCYVDKLVRTTLVMDKALHWYTPFILGIGPLALLAFCISYCRYQRSIYVPVSDIDEDEDYLDARYKTYGTGHL